MHGGGGGGHAWQGGMCGGGGVCGREVCVAGMGACMAWGACMAGGHAWQGGHVWQGACMAGGHVWQGGMHGREACMAGVCVWQGACMACTPPQQILQDTVIRSMSGRYASCWNAFLLSSEVNFCAFERQTEFYNTMTDLAETSNILQNFSILKKRSLAVIQQL